MVPGPQLIVEYAGIGVDERTIKLASFNAKNVTCSRSVAAEAIQRAGIKPLLSACAGACVDDDVFGESVGDKVGIGVIRAPFVSDPVNGAIGIANEETGFETFKETRVRVVDWKLKMFDEYGAIGK